jgi:hypothetical protein
MGDVIMAISVNTGNKIKETGKKVTRQASSNPLVELVARVGYGVRGLLYFTIGLLAVQLALGHGGKAADQQGAIAVIGKQPAGQLLLWVVLIGLVSYALWGLIRALLDPLHKGKDLKGIAERVGFLFSAAAYALLVFPTYAAIAGGRKQAHNGAQTEQTQEYVTKILSMNSGRWMVGFIGVLVIAVGMYQIYEGFRLHFDGHIQPRSMSPQKAGWVKRAGQFGTVARGVVFALIGLFLFLAAIQNNPGKAKGFDETLLSLLQQPYGPWLMGTVAVGLIAFGIYSIFCGLWFRVKK